MKYKLIVVLLLTLTANFSFGQKKPYFTNGSDFIFSYGLATDSSGADVTSNLRFSGWYHANELLNIDFSKSAGFVTGLGLANVGMITRPGVGIIVKQRAYSLGVPVAFRFGDLDRKRFFTVGAEGELMLDYKEKVFKDGKKVQKHHEWLSNNSNLLNPAVFLKYQKKSVYVCAKYYLMDFFKPSDIKIDEISFIPAFPKTSQIFYISIGYSGKGKSKGNKINAPAPPKKVNRT